MPILSMNEDLEVERIWRGLEESHVRRPDILFSLPHDGVPGYCLDYHGGVHGRDGRAEEDAVRANELLAFGLQPFAIWHAQYEGTAYLDRLVDGVLRGKLGLPAHRVTAARRALELARREALLAELDVIDGLSWGEGEGGRRGGAGPAHYRRGAAGCRPRRVCALRNPYVWARRRASR